MTRLFHRFLDRFQHAQEVDRAWSYVDTKFKTYDILRSQLRIPHLDLRERIREDYENPEPATWTSSGASWNFSRVQLNNGIVHGLQAQQWAANAQRSWFSGALGRFSR